MRYIEKNQMVMKKNIIAILLCLAAILCTSCRSLTYKARRLEAKALRTNDEREKYRYLARADWCRTLDSVNKVAEYYKNDTLCLTLLCYNDRGDDSFYDTVRLMSSKMSHSFETPYKPYYAGRAGDITFYWGRPFSIIYHHLDGHLTAYL